MIDRNYFAIVLLLMITVFISWGFYFYDYKLQDNVNINEIPSVIDTWVSQDLPIDKADLAILETRNTFLRRYTDNNGRHVYLYISYSQSSPKATNPPEVFYKGSGISIIDKGIRYIIIASSNLSFKVNWLILDNNENQQIAYYWYKVGGIFTHSYWKQRSLSAFNNIIGKLTISKKNIIRIY